MSPTPQDIQTAAKRLAAFLRPTPVVRCETFDAWLKLENLQATGSYKVRGALNALLLAAEEGDRRPVIAASAGNHAQGVAWAAKRLGLVGYLVIPKAAPATKRAGIERLGGRVIAFGDCFEDAECHARDLSRTNDWRFIHAFEDSAVIAGQATVGVEAASLAPDVVVVPVGGGGLASGVGLALMPLRARVIGVQIRGVQGMMDALAGATDFPEPAATIADGVKVRTPGLLTRQICARVLDDIIVVTEDEVREAMRLLALRSRIVAEGAGAIAAAGLQRVSGDRRLAVVSGGNVDAAVLRSVLAGAPMNPEVSPQGPSGPTRRI